jgi:hypothetical protein
LEEKMIIELILIIGRFSLAFIDSLNELVGVAGVMGAVTLLLIVTMIILIKSFSKELKAQSDATVTLSTVIGILADKVSSPYMSTEQSLIVYRSIMKEHSQKILDYLSFVLEVNNIQIRRSQIEENIKQQFKDITGGEAFKLSQFKSVCGDMGKILQDNLAWEVILEDTYKVFFSEDKIHTKMMDMKAILNGSYNTIAKIIDDNGVHNR